MSDQDPTWPSNDDQPQQPSTPPPPPPGGSPPPPPPAPGGSMSTVGQTADIGVRLGARVIDAILLGIVSSVIFIPLVIAMAFSNAGNVNPMLGAGTSAAGIVAGLLALAINFGYYVFMDTRMGKTVGKMLLNLEVKGASGGLPTVEESVKRNAWLALSIIPIIGGLLQLGAAIYIAVTISNDSNNVGWHDVFAGGTRVVMTK